MPEPSKFALPVIVPVKAIFLAVFNLVAVAALPVQLPDEPDTLVCNGCTWSPLDTLAALPAEAVPGAEGDVFE